jgi:hypothetical protein
VVLDPLVLYSVALQVVALQVVALQVGVDLAVDLGVGLAVDLGVDLEVDLAQVQVQWVIVILPLQLVAVLIAAIHHLDFDQNMVLPESIDLDPLQFELQQKKHLVDLSIVVAIH